MSVRTSTSTMANISLSIFTLLICSYVATASQFRNLTVPEFPLSSAEQNGKMVIVDSNGSRVKLACVNWYGFQLEDLVINGLDRQPLEKITGRIVELGFNCVRLVYSLDVFYKNPVVSEARLSENPDLIGSRSFQIFDKVVETLTDAGLMVILNNHVSSAGWCCSIDDGEGLWYTDTYPEEVFFEHWTMLAKRYLDNPWVVGADLRNEIRSIPGGIFGHIPETWGTGFNSTDWKMAAEEAARRIQNVNPDILIIVGGILSNVVLSPAYFAPVQIPDQSKLVYTGHIYAFSTELINLPYEQVETLFFLTQRFVEVPGHSYSAPFWMGEFGDGENSENWLKIYQHIKDHDLDWGYWPLDGYKYPGVSESYGILEDDFWTVRHDWKLEQLQQIMEPLSH